MKKITGSYYKAFLSNIEMEFRLLQNVFKQENNTNTQFLHKKAQPVVHLKHSAYNAIIQYQTNRNPVHSLRKIKNRDLNANEIPLIWFKCFFEDWSTKQGDLSS